MSTGAEQPGTGIAASATIIIPARLGSSRFPGKVLASDTGKPLVQHVAEGASRARCAARVVVATDSPRVRDALAPFGTEVVLTSPDHANGTSRLAEAARVLGLAPEAIVVNAQGDEPEMPGPVIDAAVTALVEGGAGGAGGAGVSIGTAAAPLGDAGEAANPHVVKVVRDLRGRALYFSRAAIPHDRDGTRDPAAGPLRHVGVYAYRRAFLEAYAALPATPLERSEQLEQLRALEHGHGIAVALVPAAHAGIDTPEQYAAFVARWRAARARGGG